MSRGDRGPDQPQGSERGELERLRAIFDQAPAFMAVLRGPDHVFGLVNPRYYEVVGHRDLLGRPVREALPEVEGQGYFELLDRVYETGEAYVGRENRVMLQREPGAPLDERFVDFVYQPLEGPDGQTFGILAHGHDVTGKVHARRNVERLYDEVKRANEAKRDFLAVMSHELRTPLNAIVGYADLLADGVVGEVDSAQEEQLERVRENAEYLTQLIDEILLFAEGERAAPRVHLEEVDAEALLRKVAADIEVPARRKQLDVRVRAPEPGIVLETDPGKLLQVLRSLAQNAVKFTDEGEIELAAHENEDAVRLSVRDTGIGIPPENRERILEPFTRGESGLTRRTRGTGLGLAVASKLVGLLGGEIIVESEVGSGSTFTVELPKDSG